MSRSHMDHGLECEFLHQEKDVFDLCIPLMIECTQFLCITKTRIYAFDPLKPHFYIVKLGFTGVYISFIILLKTKIVGTR